MASEVNTMLQNYHMPVSEPPMKNKRKLQRDEDNVKIYSSERADGIKLERKAPGSEVLRKLIKTPMTVHHEKSISKHTS